VTERDVLKENLTGFAIDLVKRLVGEAYDALEKENDAKNGEGSMEDADGYDVAYDLLTAINEKIDARKPFEEL